MCLINEHRGTPLRTLRTCVGTSHTNALIQSNKFYYISWLVIKRGLELMTSTLDSTFRNEEVTIWTPLLASSPPRVLLRTGLGWKFSSELCERMEVEISSSVKFFGLYLRGREARCWGNIGAFEYVKSQSMVEILLTHDHTGGIHNASMTRQSHPWLCLVPTMKLVFPASQLILGYKIHD